MAPHVSTICFFAYKMPFGHITIASDGHSVIRVALGAIDLPGIMRADSITNACADQILEYLSGKRTVFDVPFTYGGSPFKKRVWDAICAIPYSHTRTAQEVASAAGSPTSYRQVGAAVNENPLVLLIPAHRVIPANGRTDTHDEHAMLRQAFRDLERKYA